MQQGFGNQLLMPAESAVGPANSDAPVERGERAWRTAQLLLAGAPHEPTIEFWHRTRVRIRDTIGARIALLEHVPASRSSRS